MTEEEINQDDKLMYLAVERQVCFAASGWSPSHPDLRNLSSLCYFLPLAENVKLK